MGKGLRVHVSNGQDGSSFERVFDELPIRIGRDPLNELPLDFQFVSKFHAVLDLQGERLLLRDLGSRNGTSLRTPTERIPANESVDLAKSEGMFGIAAVRFQCTVIDVDRTSSASLRRPRGGAILSHVPELDLPEAHVTATGLGGDDVGRAADAARADLDAWRASWGRAYSRLSNALATLSVEKRAGLVQRLVKEHPALLNEPDFKHMAEHLGIALDGAAAAPGGSREEAVALLILRDLASWYVDAEKPPQTVTQLVAFGRKIQDVLDALFVSFVPLRDGLRSFEAEFDVKVGVETYGARAPAESAKNPAELAARLLSWTEASDSGRVVKRVFADLMVHNVGVVNGVMRGAAALLKQLAPETLEHELDADRARGKSTLSVGPLRYRALWEVLKRRHDDLSNEEQERFALLFGSDFAHAYAQLTDAARLTKTPEVSGRASGHGHGHGRGTGAPPAKAMGPTGTVVVESPNGAPKGRER